MVMTKGIKLLFLALVLLGKDVTGQTAESRTPTRTQKESSGRFAVDFRKSGQADKRVDVNFSSVVSSSSVNLTFETSETMLFMANIINAENKLVTRWQPQEKNNHYSPSIDITSLPAGTYRIDIFAEHYPGISHTISFTKE